MTLQLKGNFKTKPCHFWLFLSPFCHFFGYYGHKYAYYAKMLHMHNP